MIKSFLNNTKHRILLASILLIFVSTYLYGDQFIYIEGSYSLIYEYTASTNTLRIVTENEYIDNHNFVSGPIKIIVNNDTVIDSFLNTNYVPVYEDERFFASVFYKITDHQTYLGIYDFELKNWKTYDIEFRYVGYIGIYGNYIYFTSENWDSNLRCINMNNGEMSIFPQEEFKEYAVLYQFENKIYTSFGNGKYAELVNDEIGHISSNQRIRQGKLGVFLKKYMENK